MSFGHGLAGFISGIPTGMELRARYDERKNKREIDKIREEGLAGAKEAYEKDVSKIGFTPEQRLPSGREIPGTSSWNIGDQSFKTEAEAKATIKSVDDRFFESVIPRIKQKYIEQGKLDKAEGWEKYVDSKKGKKAFKEWSDGMRAFQMGDAQGLAKYVSGQYKSFNDGLDLEGDPDPVKNDEGVVTGFNITVKNQETGETINKFIDNSSLAQYGMMALGQGSPEKAYEAFATQQREASKLAAETKIQSQRDKLRREHEVSLEGIRQHGRYKLEQYKSNLKDQDERKRFNRTVQMLRNANYSDAEISTLVPAVLGIQTGGDNQSELRKTIYKARLRDDWNFSRMTQYERMQVIENDMAVLRGEKVPKVPRARTSTQTPPPSTNPEQGLPKAVLDRKTGQVIYVQ
jgi:hypothetical protein